MHLLLPTRTLPADPSSRMEAVRVLAAGGLVAFPTETVYGLGANAADAKAVAALYRAKGRPSFNPLIAHVADLDTARRFADFPEAAARLAAAFWPGPLTLVLPKAQTCAVSELATAGLDSIAIRVPDHPFARDLLRGFGGAIVAPSANRSGHVSPTSAAHVEADLGGRIDLIVDGGPVAVGVESTIVDCLGAPTMLRPGGLSRAAVEAALGYALAEPEHDTDDVAPRAPGLLTSHYAPATRLRLNSADVASDEALLAFGAPLMGARVTLNLSASGNVDEAAAKLFGYLRELDAAGARMIAVMPIPNEGLGEAINDRLRRGAAPRDDKQNITGTKP